MHLLLILWLALCGAGIVLSVRSAAVLGAASPFTRLGWAFTVVYFIIAAVDAARATSAPAHADYIALGALVLAFSIAGVRDEPQAEPWLWPGGAGRTGRERGTRK